ncbi:uncharacterized protein LOC130504498 [Raphanus sativus]|uniref:Uncharacterized protein LOC130504498 n=1 Tax=Raphanus sativus TaxID=3726 RepID=A0A9W3CUE9_RAPSA|nr:uncharacterized protein LOC130504498 [Raphanus sativus]
MVRRNPFKGSSLEHPQDHIEGLEELIPDEYSRCRIFPFSLEWEALRWLNCLPKGSLTSWKEIRNVFLKQFFDDTRYWEVRRRISTFHQNPQESFKNTWGRFKSYELECPHHGYPEPQFLKIFYKGVILSYKTTLDTESEGNFVTRNPIEARRLIENMATGRSYEEINEEKEKAINSRENTELAEIKNSIDSLHSLLTDRNPPNLCQYYNKTPPISEDELDFTEELDTTDPHSVFNVDSFTRDYEICVQSRTGREKYNLKQAFTGNRKMKSDFNGKINIVYGKLNQKMDSLIEHLRGMEDQIANLATTLKRETGRLPGRTDANPGAKRQAYAVMLRSGKRLETNARDDASSGKIIDNAEKSNSNPIELLENDSDPGISKQRRNYSNKEDEGRTIDLGNKNSDAEIEIDRLDEPIIDRPIGKENDRPSGGTNDSNTQPTGTEKVYRTPPPFPPNKPQTKKALDAPQ